MAGTDKRFDAAKFRAGIHTAMTMGFPNETEEQVVWHWDTERTFTKADSGGAPFDWTAAQVATASVITDLTVNCAIKFIPGGGKTRVGGTAEGIFDTSQLIVTLLDTEWDLIITHGGRFPEGAVVNTVVYETQFVAPPVGLFDVNVYEVYLQAVDAASGNT